MGKRTKYIRKLRHQRGWNSHRMKGREPVKKIGNIRIKKHLSFFKKLLKKIYGLIKKR